MDITQLRKIEEYHFLLFERSKASCMDCAEPDSDYVQYVRKMKSDLLDQIALIKERSVVNLARQCSSEESADELSSALALHRGRLISTLAKEADDVVKKVERRLREFPNAFCDPTLSGSIKSDEEANAVMEIFRKSQAYFDELSELLHSLHLPTSAIEMMKGNLDVALTELRSRLEALTSEEDRRKNVESTSGDPNSSVDRSTILPDCIAPEGCFDPLSVIRETLHLAHLKFIGERLIETEWKPPEGSTTSSEPLKIVLQFHTCPKPRFEAVEVYEAGENRPDILAKVREMGLSNFVAQRAEGRI
ncbi:hypothetical protein M514_12897 [Trichuris suis]|uniref:Uncharacterized protein n=1 Tax=Trichuris suis TaxID=68888 RepID=A0A085NE22_9BILA|nr:hypothetical protein M514_12897 [Trichuris suis]